MMQNSIRKTLSAVAVSGLLVAGSAGVASADDDTTREHSERHQQVEDNLTFGDFLEDAFSAADFGNGNGSATGNGNGNEFHQELGNGNGSGNQTDVDPDVDVDPQVDPHVEFSPEDHSEDNSTEDNSTEDNSDPSAAARRVGRPGG